MVEEFWEEAMAEYGGARKAARTLGLSESAFNRTRLRATYIYDPISRDLTPVDPDQKDLRSFLEGRHLVAPSLAGARLPGRPWTFRLDLLQKYREFGWPGAEFPVPAPESNGDKWGDLAPGDRHHE